MTIRGTLSIRRLERGDAEALDDVKLAAFDDLAVRLTLPATQASPPEVRRARSLARTRHVLRTDPDGSWCADAGDGLMGVAMSIRRGGLWGLALLVVHPAFQGGGVGRALFSKAFEYSAGSTGKLILSSPDSRALRTYMGAGLDLRPAVGAEGMVRRELLPAGLDVSDDGDPDLDLVDAVDRVVRGASHRQDIAELASFGARFLKIADRYGRGYAVVNNGPLLLAATSAGVAQRLLWSSMALTQGDTPFTAAVLDARQQWAFDVIVRARIGLGTRARGLMVQGDVGPLTPYIPNGIYL